MASTNTIKTRIQLKSDTEQNWNNNGENFIPLYGEIIIYSPDSTHDYSRMKIGDGVNNVISLPFLDAGTVNGHVVEDNIMFYENKLAFPPTGQEGKLYIDLAKNIIYRYTPANGFIQLSHFRYTTTKNTIPIVNNWDAGIMTTIAVDNYILTVTNGTAPQLNLNNIDIVTDIQEVIENG